MYVKLRFWTKKLKLTEKTDVIRIQYKTFFRIKRDIDKA